MKKLKLIFIYFLPVFIIFTSFSIFIYVYYKTQISTIVTKITINDNKQTNDKFKQVEGKAKIMKSFTKTGWLNLNDKQKIEYLKYLKYMQNKIDKNSIYLIIITLFCITFGFGIFAYYLAGKSLKPLEEALKKQKDFVSNASHEIKTPLAIIKTEAEVLLRNKSSSLEEYKEFTKNTIKDINYLDILTNNLLILAQIDKKINIKLENININSVTKEVLNSFKNIFNEKGIKINNEIKKDINILANKDFTHQVFTIIIDNILKYSKSNKISINIKEEIKFFKIIIKDNGIGIPQEKLKYIFDRFYRVSEDRNQKGYGLGLAIAKDIILIQKGLINIKSEINKGTSIELFFKKV